MLEIVVRSTVQPYEKWCTAVIFKAAYMIFTVTISTLILLFYSYRGETLSKALLAGMTFFTSFVGLVALALGGAGYVERVYEGLLPFIVYSLIRAGRSALKV
ncbi:MAG: hypothetical protein RMI56_04525 [Sulfolobales archaeon]|nr:hypothetical protein [Sulfolobales archaeon]